MEVQSAILSAIFYQSNFIIEDRKKLPIDEIAGRTTSVVSRFASSDILGGLSTRRSMYFSLCLF